MASCRILISLCIYFFIFAVTNAKECKETDCAVPYGYYLDLGCKPEYGNNSCCPEKYICDHLKNKSKCFVNDHEYEIGENIREEDAYPCERNCTCILSAMDNLAIFACPDPKCSELTKEGCYRKHFPHECCPGEEICPENTKDIATCNVTGKIYEDGEFFYVEAVETESDLMCTCQPGYEGNNIAPFCVNQTRSSLYNLEAASRFYNNCAPAYHTIEDRYNGDNDDWICQENNDTIIPYYSMLLSPERHDNKNVCRFGNMTMNLGERVSDHTIWDNEEKFCVRCVCNVAPVPTCNISPMKDCERQDTEFMLYSGLNITYEID